MGAVATAEVMWRYKGSGELRGLDWLLTGGVCYHIYSCRKFEWA